MSRQADGSRDPETMKHVIIKQADGTLRLVMPPMDKKAKLNRMRCARYLLDMIRGSGNPNDEDGEYYKPEEIVLMPIPGSGSKEFLFCVKMYCEM